MMHNNSLIIFYILLCTLSWYLFICLYPAGLGQHGSRFRDVLIDGFVPPSSSVAPMFPFYDNTSDWDDFGEVVNPDDYVIKDEDMDQGATRVSACFG